MSSCFGKCPQYNATIMPDGRVSLKAIANVSILGTRILKFKPEVINKIMTDLDNVNFFELDSVYDNQYVMDIPQTSLTVTSNFGEKSVMSRYDAPQDLIIFYKYIHTELMVLLDAEALRIKNRPKPHMSDKDKNPIKKGTDTKR